MIRYLPIAGLSLRRIIRAPEYYIIASLVLGLGVGVNSVLFGVLDALVLRPASRGLEEPDHLARINPGQSDAPPFVPSFTFPAFQHLEVAAPFPIAAYSRMTLALGQSPRIESVEAIAASDRYFDVLGVSPRIGRFFSRSGDGRSENALVAVLSFDAWRGRFGGRPDAIGQTLDLNGLRFEIIGVAPQGFVGADLGRPAVWVPLRAAGREELGGPQRLRERTYWLQIIARYRTAIRSRISNVSMGGMAVSLEPLRTLFDDTQYGQNPTPLWIFLTSAMVFVVACANVGLLKLFRLLTRAPVTAIQIALGAGARTLVVESLVEGLLLVAGATLVSLLFCVASSQLLTLLPIPPLGDMVTLRVAILAVAAALVSVAASAVFPGLLALRADIRYLIAAGERTFFGRGALKKVLIGSQIAMSLALLIVSGLFIRSVQKVNGVDLGFDPAGVVVIERESIPGSSSSGGDAFDANLMARLRAMPGTGAVSRTNSVPFESSFELPIGREPTGGSNKIMMPGARVDPDFFKVLSIDLVNGRLLDERDRNGSTPVIVLNRRAAQLLSVSGDVLGECVYLLPGSGDACRVVVGVVENGRFRELTGDLEPFFYVPLDQALPFTAGDQSILVSGVEQNELEALREIAQSAALDPVHVSVTPLATFIGRQTILWRVVSTLTSLLGVIAASLTTFGVFALVSHLGEIRSKELSIRAALGATQSKLLKLLISDTWPSLAWGIGAGVVLAGVVGRAIESRLFGVTATDLPSFAVAIVMITVGAFVATLLPGIRMTQDAPLRAMRAE